MSGLCSVRVQVCDFDEDSEIMLCSAVQRGCGEVCCTLIHKYDMVHPREHKDEFVQETSWCKYLYGYVQRDYQVDEVPDVCCVRTIV